MWWTHRSKAGRKGLFFGNFSSAARISAALFCGVLAGLSAPLASNAADWGDEFDGTAGSLPDGSKWNIETGTHGFGANEVQAYTDRPTNVQLDGQGNLKITALRENYAGMQYTSARVHTYGTFMERTGTYEFRAKVPVGMGLGPAIWTTGYEGPGTWPQRCELDILEHFVGPFRLTNSVICSDLSNPNNAASGTATYPTSDLSGWHTYRVDKDLLSMKIYVDGKLSNTFDKAGFAQWQFDKWDHYIVLNLAVGGDRPWGYPDSSTPFPATMLVDYVRWWAAIQGAPTPTAPTTPTTPTPTPTPTPTLPPAPIPTSGNIVLKVDTGSRPAADGTPSSTGVLLPEGIVKTVNELMLRSAQGSEILAGYKSLATWPDGSVKSALISFVPTAQSGKYADVGLQYGPSVTHTNTGNVQVTQDAQSLTITNELLRLQFSKQRFTVLEQAWTDLNSDGSFADAEKWLSAPADMIVVDDKSGKTFKGSLWLADDGYAPKLIEASPSKVTVLLEGRLKGVGGAVTADGDPTLVQAKIWLSVYAGSSLVHMETTFVDTKSRPTESFSEQIMRLAGVAIEMPLTLTGTSYAVGGENGAVYQGSNNSGTQLLQDAASSFNGNFSYQFKYSGAGSGAQAPGWMDVSNSQRGLAFGVRHFWQNYPKKLAVSAANVVRVELLPEGSSEKFWTVYPGVGKTHEGFFDFHAGGYTATVKQRAELMLFAPPMLIADPSWYVATDAFGPLTVPSAASTHWEAYMDRQYNCTVNRTGCSILPLPYGQRNFGDYVQSIGTDSAGKPFPEFGDGHYEDAHGAILQFARTGQRRWFDYAVGGARHHYDLDVMHTQNARYPGFPAGMIHWHGTAEHEGSSIELGHVVPGGLDEYYLLTGDPRALEVIREQGDWVTYWARTGGGRVAPETSNDQPGLTEYERPTAWTLHTVMKAYEATGDPKYLEGASILVKNTIDWWKWPQDHIVFDPNKPLDLSKPAKDQALFYQRSDWTQGTGYPLPTLRVDNCSQTSAPLNNYAYQTHAPIAWMSGLLQNSLIRYYRTLEKIGGRYNKTVDYRGAQTPIDIDDATMREMLIQMVNMVANFTFAGAPLYPSQYPWESQVSHNAFIYTVCPERDPASANGGQYLAFSFEFVSDFDPAEVGSRWQADWANLIKKWRYMAYKQYEIIVMQRTDADTSYNGAGDMWALPNGLALLERDGIINASSIPVPGGGSGGGGGSTTPPASSVPAYQVTVNDGNPFITNPIVDLKITVPANAVEINVSPLGFGRGTWTGVESEIHGIQLPVGAGEKTLYIQFRNSTGAVQASLMKSLVLLQPGFNGDVSLTLNEPEDTFVFSDTPDNNYAGRPQIQFGRYDNGYDYAALLRFPIPALPSGVKATVLGGSLNVFVNENERNAQQVITPYEVTQDWSENLLKWTTLPTLASSTLGSGLLFNNASEVNRWKSFPLNTAVLQRWVDDPTLAKGIELKGAGTPGMTVLKAVSSESFVPADDLRPSLVLQLRLASSDVIVPGISNLQVADIAINSATVKWETSEDADGIVAYGTTTGYGQTLPQSGLTKVHAVTLSGLSKNTLYHIKVTSKDAQGNSVSSGDVTFTTMSTLQGDMNGDGKLTALDIPELVKRILGLSNTQLDQADMNEDGRISIADVQLLANLL